MQSIIALPPIARILSTVSLLFTLTASLITVLMAPSKGIAENSRNKAAQTRQTNRQPATNQNSNLIFDAYYKVLAGRRHVGYVIHRYRFDPTTKHFHSIHYLRTNAVAGNQTESLAAVSNDRFHPISYQFTQTIGNKVKIIDANFKGLNLSATVSDGQKAQKLANSHQKGTFLSIFLVPLMMSKGIATDRRYQYSGIAEENGKSYRGDAYVEKKMTTYKGQKVFKVLNVFKDQKFFFYLNEKGETLGSRSPAQQISTEIVLDPLEATRGMPVNGAHLKKLFGEIPAGQTHALSPSSQKQQVQQLSTDSVVKPSAKPPTPGPPVPIGNSSNNSAVAPPKKSQEKNK